MANQPAKHNQNTILAGAKTCAFPSAADDSHVHRQTKLHKTFIVHGRHHIRVPSYGRNLNKLSKNHVLGASAVPVIADDSKTQAFLVKESKKHVLQPETNNTVENVAENDSKDVEEAISSQNEDSEQLKVLIQTEPEEKQVQSEYSKKDDFSSTKSVECLSEDISDHSTKSEQPLKDKPITSRLVSMMNNQAATPYLTCETATVKNTTIASLIRSEENRLFSACGLPLGDTNKSNNVQEDSAKVLQKIGLKPSVSEHSFKNYANRTQQKLLLQRELSLSCFKSDLDDEQGFQGFIQRQIDRINKEYANILHFINPSKYVILKLFHDGCLDGIKQTSNSLNCKTTEEKSNKNTSRMTEFMNKREHNSKEFNKLKIENDISTSIQAIIEKMWNDKNSS